MFFIFFECQWYCLATKATTSANFWQLHLGPGQGAHRFGGHPNGRQDSFAAIFALRMGPKPISVIFRDCYCEHSLRCFVVGISWPCFASCWILVWRCTRWVNLDPEATRTGNTAPINVVPGGCNKSQCRSCAWCTAKVMMSEMEIGFLDENLSKADAYLWHWQLRPICFGSSEPSWCEGHWQQQSGVRDGVERSWHIGCDGEVVWNWFMSILGQLEDMAILKGTKTQSGGKHAQVKLSVLVAKQHKIVVLVDGRFRVACFLKMLKSMAPQDLNSTQILIHDYERPEYHVIEEFAELVGRRGRLALFHPKPPYMRSETRLQRHFAHSSLG